MRAPRTAAVLALLLAASAGARASDPPGRPLPPEPKAVPEITADEIRYAVAWLADDARDGRETDTDGCRESARWIAARMKALGLETIPEAPDHLIPWTLPGGVPEPEGCSLEIARGEETAAFAYGKDFVAMPGGAAGSVDAAAAFAGYGITAPELQYDDYATNDAKGRVAFVFRHEPREKDPKSRWNGDRMTGHSWFARKVAAAAAAGAAALVVVNDPLNHEKDDLDAGGSELGVESPIPVLFASAAVAGEILRGAGLAPKDLQKSIDDADAPVAVALEGVRVRLKTTVRKASSENVVGVLRGSDPKLRDEWVVVGAHYDHVGRGHSGGLDRRLYGQIHNGADDNASGTAALLEVAGWFAGQPARTRRSILFAAYSGEERGLLGSAALVARDLPPRASIAAQVNLDMVGRYRPGQFEVVGAATGSTLKSIVDRAAEGLGLEYRHTNSGLGSSDGYSYYLAGIPTVFFFTGLHDDYHRPADDWWLVDAAGTAKVAEFAARTTRLLAEDDSRPVHAKVPQNEIPIGRSGRVILGVLLDETADGKGARIVSLTRRSPAGKAGIKEGDRIVSLGGQEVKDAEGLRAALARVRPGETVPVTILRGEERIEVKVEFPGPPGPVFGVAWDDSAKGATGALVREVAPGSVAEKAGVKPGDRILSFGGREVADAAALPAVLRTATAGAKVKVRVLRDGAEVELEAAFP
ncbi:MAG TPA: M20/M25/M40 family metallo-hydrolase [Planctomycetota bacterium]|nr:M20/M25/M40 family metallo-hydrolase [Planctomycetota bacterium]